MKDNEQVIRTCRGYVAAVLFLNKGELEALRRLLDAYTITESEDPDIPRLRQVLDGIGVRG